MVWIELGYLEMCLATSVACQLQIKAVLRGYNDPSEGKPDDKWKHHIIGALGEMALCKHLNIYWNGNMDTFKAADVGGDLQVRTTVYDRGHLTVYPEDDDEHVYVLMIVKGDKIRVAGSLKGRDAKQEKYYRVGPENRKAAYWIPQSDLREFVYAKKKNISFE